MDHSSTDNGQSLLSTRQYFTQPPASIHHSSEGWSPKDDQILITAARPEWANWPLIQQVFFPSKTLNACRKRYESLMERSMADDWDGRKLENLSKNYMIMRREIWRPLALAGGEKWNVVEQKVPA